MINLYVCYNNEFGGGHKMLLSWLNESKKRKIDTLTLIRSKSKLKEYLIFYGHNFLEVDLGEINKRKNILYNVISRINSAFKVYSQIKKLNININIIHAIDTFSYIAILLPGIFLGKKIIWTIQDNVKIHIFIRLILIIFCKKIILCANILKKEFKLFSNYKIKVITNGININGLDLEELREKLENTRNRKKLKLGFIGRLDENKNVKQIINAVSLLKLANYDFELFIVGNGAEEKNLHALSKKMDLDKNIKFTGWVENPQLFYKQIDLFIQVSKTEAFSLSILEALHFGLPCIVTDVGDNKVLIENNHNGYITEIDNHNDTAKKIMKLHDNRELINDFSYNSLQKSSSFSYKMMIKKYFKLYENL